MSGGTSSEGYSGRAPYEPWDIVRPGNRVEGYATLEERRKYACGSVDVCNESKFSGPGNVSEQDRHILQAIAKKYHARIQVILPEAQEEVSTRKPLETYPDTSLHDRINVGNVFTGYDDDGTMSRPQKPTGGMWRD